jgi:hypothetical protein
VRLYGCEKDFKDLPEVWVDEHSPIEATPLGSFIAASLTFPVPMPDVPAPLLRLPSGVALILRVARFSFQARFSASRSCCFEFLKPRMLR